MYFGPVRSDVTKNPKIMPFRTEPDRRPTRTVPYHFGPVLGPEFWTNSVSSLHTLEVVRFYRCYPNTAVSTSAFIEKAFDSRVSIFFTVHRSLFAPEFTMDEEALRGVHEKKKVGDAFESPHATVTVMEEVRIESVDEVVAVINDGDGEVKVLNLVQQTIDVESTSNNDDFGCSLPPYKGADLTIGDVVFENTKSDLKKDKDE
nr:hypothetical protein [Tanacetum cinerariifolium]